MHVPILLDALVQSVESLALISTTVYLVYCNALPVYSPTRSKRSSPIDVYRAGGIFAPKALAVL